MKKIGLLPKLIIAIIIGVILGKLDFIPLVKGMATFNGIFGNFLGFVIPLIIIGFVAPGIGDLGKGAGKVLGITALIAYFSTVFAGTMSFFVNSAIFPKILVVGSMSLTDTSNPEHALLDGFFNIEMPPIMGVMTALLLAFTLGLGIAASEGNTIKKFMKEFQGIVEGLIKKMIIPMLPFHIAGIFANMAHAGQVETIMSVFFKVFIIIFTIHIVMIFLQYTVAGSLAGANPIKLIRNMIPAYFTAVGTQSSAAAIPVTLEQTIKNGVENEIADFTVPLCATIHLSGSTITIVSCAMAVMMLNGVTITFVNILGFILMLGITMVAAPGVPGGAVMAALGLLETMLGFTPTLISLMIALYLAQDSLGTACNVTGDGAIAIIVNRISGNKLKTINGLVK